MPARWAISANRIAQRRTARSAKPRDHAKGRGNPALQTLLHIDTAPPNLTLALRARGSVRHRTDKPANQGYVFSVDVQGGQLRCPLRCARQQTRAEWTSLRAERLHQHETHTDCWESWRMKELQSERPRWPPSRHASAQRWFLCTRHSDGRIFCAEQADLAAALSALRTFLDTSRHLGYQVRSQHPAPSPRTIYIARQGTAWVMFWISEANESTAVFEEP